MEEDDCVFTSYSLSLSLTGGALCSASAAEPPGCSSLSLSLLDATAAALLAPERLPFGTRQGTAVYKRRREKRRTKV